MMTNIPNRGRKVDPKKAEKEEKRRRIKQNITDVATGRAAVEGVKVIGRAVFSNALRTDDRHNDIIRKKKK